MFDRFERGTISWGELRSLAAELQFLYIVNAMKREVGYPDAADETQLPPIDFNTLRRLLHTPTVAAALEKESAHHTSAYQYKVIEKCMQLLIHGHVRTASPVVDSAILPERGAVCFARTV